MNKESRIGNNAKRGESRKSLVVYSSLLVLLAALFISSFSVPTAFAQNGDSLPSDNINQPGFKLIVCDGPTLPDSVKNNMDPEKLKNYVPCDFNGLMKQVQHLIDVMLVLGVIAAIAGFLYAGYVYISAGMTGDSNAHSKALDIFRKIGVGLIIMLSAWFIVFQILAWLTGNGSGFGVLLGKG